MWVKADRLHTLILHTLILHTLILHTLILHTLILHTLILRATDRWKAIYRTWGAVEGEFGTLKHEWGLGPLRVRCLPRVRLHIDPTILARLASALIKARAVPLAA